MAKSLFRKREVVQYEILALQVDNKRKAVGNQFVSDGFGGQDGKHNHCFIRELAADGKPTPKSYLIGFDGNVLDNKYHHLFLKSQILLSYYFSISQYIKNDLHHIY